MVWTKGQSGNPKGRPPAGQSITEHLKRLILLPAEGKSISRLQAIADKILELAVAGEEWAVKTVWERLEGKVKDTLELQDNRPSITIHTNAAPPEIQEAEDKLEDKTEEVVH